MPLPDSEEFNLIFVQVIETCWCLYDITSPQYSSKDEQAKAWKYVAQKFSSTETECKTRWKHLRGALTRYIKNLRGQSGQATKSMKQYYLWDAMQFVLPYLKSRIRTGNLPPFGSANENEYPDDMEGDPDDSAASNHETSREVHETTESDAASTSSHTSAKRGRKRLKSSADDPFEKIIVKCISKMSEKPENPDLDFFKSILPDMAAFNASQKRRFKQKVLQLLEDISNEGATLTS